MRGPGTTLAGCLLVAAAMGGCNGAKIAAGADGWRDVLPGDGGSDWWVVKGEARTRGDTLLVNPDPSGKSIVVFKRPVLRDGTIELEVLREGPAIGGGPYTITTRLNGLFNWSGIYFICRPESVEACRGSKKREYPDTEAVGGFDASTGPETWRLVLSDGRITCYRNGKQVVTYQDTDPREGRLAVTADRCRLAIRKLRYRTQQPGAPTPAP